MGCGSSSPRFIAGEYCLAKFEGAFSPAQVVSVSDTGYTVCWVEDEDDDQTHVAEDDAIDFPDYTPGRFMGYWDDAWHPCQLLGDGKTNTTYIVHFDDDEEGDNTELEEWQLHRQ